jgi:hypothetical protein
MSRPKEFVVCGLLCVCEKLSKNRNKNWFGVSENLVSRAHLMFFLNVESISKRGLSFGVLLWNLAKCILP